MQHIFPHDSHKVSALQEDGVLTGFLIRNILPTLIFERPIDLHNEALFYESRIRPINPLTALSTSWTLPQRRRSPASSEETALHEPL